MPYLAMFTSTFNRLGVWLIMFEYAWFASGQAHSWFLIDCLICFALSLCQTFPERIRRADEPNFQGSAQYVSVPMCIVLP